MRTATVLALVVTLVGGCSASGSGSKPRTGTTRFPPAASPYGKPIEAGGLRMRVQRPTRRASSPNAVEVEVTFEAIRPGDDVATPNPVLTCEAERYEIDDDIANYPSEVNDDDSGTWGWSPGPTCQQGRFTVGDTTFSFTSIPTR